MKNLKPITRHEQFLQDIADGEVDLKPITRQEYFLAKIAESGGGGGSSLPSYTSSDVGKVLTVSEADPVETEVVVVPEQSVTFTNVGRPETPQYMGVLTGVNIAPLSDGDTVTVYVEGTAYTAHYYPTEYYQINGAVDIYRRKSDNEWVAWLNYDSATEGTYTVSATAITSVTPSVQTVIVPEQTVTISAEMPFSVLSGTDDSALQNIREGATAIAVINGTTYQAVGMIEDGMPPAYFVNELNAVFAYSVETGAGIAFIGETEGGTYTVSLTVEVPKVKLKWESSDNSLLTTNV